MALTFKTKNGGNSGSDGSSNNSGLLNKFRSIQAVEVPEGVEMKVINFKVFTFEQTCGCGSGSYNFGDVHAIVPADFSIDGWVEKKRGKEGIDREKLKAVFGQFSVYSGNYKGKVENHNKHSYETVYSGN